MKRYIFLALTALFALTANAQTGSCNNGACCFSPYWYIQAQGGVQIPYTPGKRGDLMSPVFGLNIGRQVTPLVGVRLGAEGWNSKVKDQYVADTYNKFKYYAVSFDATLNLVNLFTKKFYWVEEDCWISLNISAAGLRLINKIGLDAAIKQAAEKGYLQ